MISYREIREELRVLVRTLAVVTTGSTSLGATGTTYTRAAGSFLTDGFAPGMEITTVSGFTDTAKSVVKEVAALTLTVNRTLTTEAASAGRTLAVGLPTKRHWEGRDFVAPTESNGIHAPFVDEQLLPGPTRQLTTGPTATLQADPQYQLTFAVAKNRGHEALERYVDAVIELFYPSRAITLDSGDVIHVRGDTGPYRGQIMDLEPSWKIIPVSFPLRLLTSNAA